jgi:predicted dehydrogenase
MMNIYGKEASAYYDRLAGLRFLKRGETAAQPVATSNADTIRDELEEFAAAVRGDGKPEMDGERSTRSLAVVLAGIQSAREGCTVAVEDMLEREC